MKPGKRPRSSFPALTTIQINRPISTADANGPKASDVTLTRAKFNELTTHWWDATWARAQAMSDAGLKALCCTQVLLVGGSSRIPACRRP